MLLYYASLLIHRLVDLQAAWFQLHLSRHSSSLNEQSLLLFLLSAHLHFALQPNWFTDRRCIGLQNRAWDPSASSSAAFFAASAFAMAVFFSSWHAQSKNVSLPRQIMITLGSVSRISSNVFESRLRHTVTLYKVLHDPAAPLPFSWSLQPRPRLSLAPLEPPSWNLRQDELQLCLTSSKIRPFKFDVSKALHFRRLLDLDCQTPRYLHHKWSPEVYCIHSAYAQGLRVAPVQHECELRQPSRPRSSPSKWSFSSICSPKNSKQKKDMSKKRPIFFSFQPWHQQPVVQPLLPKQNLSFAPMRLLDNFLCLYLQFF